jgi:hypothetical protein
MKNYIYILTDPITNDVRYVGKSINPEVRVRKHISEAKTGKSNNHRINWIKSLLNKNLRPNIEIIDETNDDWVLLEEYWISQFTTWGFNLVNGTDGGENPPSWKGKTHSDDYKEIRRQKFLTDNPSKNMNDNWRKNISLSHKKNNFLPTKAIESNKIKVNQFTLEGEFVKTWNSITEASKSLNLKNISGIIDVCLGKRFKSANFRWSYTDKLPNYRTKTLSVKQYDLNGNFIKEWESISIASKTLIIDSSTIRKICNGRGKTAGGFKWSY